MKVSVARRERIRTIRDRAIEFVRANGAWRGAGRAKIFMAERGDLAVGYWNEFSVPKTRGTSGAYYDALARQTAPKALPYTIDIWYKSKKVLSAGWDRDDRLHVISFCVGEWEAQMDLLN